MGLSSGSALLRLAARLGSDRLCSGSASDHSLLPSQLFAFCPFVPKQYKVGKLGEGNRLAAAPGEMMYRGAQAIDILLIFSSLDDTSSMSLKSCCTAAPMLLIFSSLDGSSSTRLKLCCTAAPRLLKGILLPRWHQQRAPEVML